MTIEATIEGKQQVATAHARTRTSTQGNTRERSHQTLARIQVQAHSASTHALSIFVLLVAARFAVVARHGLLHLFLQFLEHLHPDKSQQMSRRAAKYAHGFDMADLQGRFRSLWAEMDWQNRC